MGRLRYGRNICTQFGLSLNTNMNKNKTEVIIILDRSGSMQSIKTDIEGGFKTFFDKQREQAGECFVSLYQFDTEYEMVFENKSVKDVTGITLVPRGSTALRDALGKTINTVGERLAKTPEADRPGAVIILTMTDGQENASKEFGATQIKDLVKHQTEKYQWDFVFIGANQDAVLSGADYGVLGGKSLSFAASAGGVAGAMASFSAYATRSRVATHEGTPVADMAFTDDERKDSIKSN